MVLQEGLIRLVIYYSKYDFRCGDQEEQNRLMRTVRTVDLFMSLDNFGTI